jgi:hypothetical protein
VKRVYSTVSAGYWPFVAGEAKQQGIVRRVRGELAKHLTGEPQPREPRPMASIRIIRTSGRNGRPRKTA